MRWKTYIPLLFLAVAMLIGGVDAMDAGTQATTQPAATRPVARGSQRVLFVLDASFLVNTEAAHAEILKAAAELRPIDRFNVAVVLGSRVAWAMQSEAHPTPKDLDKLERGLKILEKVYMSSGRGVSGVVAALQRRPDVVWYITNGDLDPKVADEHLEAMRRANVGVGARINTTLRFAGNSERAKWFLGEVAKRSGGVCVDAKGLPVTTATSRPVEPAPPPPASRPTGPSILRDPRQ